VSHGGDWSVQKPYDSLGAFVQAFEDGTDCVKGDLRFSSDKVGMVMHSSPVELYESVECVGIKVEDTPAAKLEKCPMISKALSNETFISASTLLAYTQNRTITMFCVKRDQDIPAAVSMLLEHGAADRAWLEIGLGPFMSMVPQVLNWEQVYYLIEINSPADIATIVNNTTVMQRERAFTVEFNGYQKGAWAHVNLTQSIASLHAAGVRTLVATSLEAPSEKAQEELFEVGFDVVYTYGTKQAVLARTTVDKARGVTPP
jgi:glycerophosphoryl diester phosphodiesterase